MAFANVVVHSVEELEQYYARLVERKQALSTLLNELSADCRQQNSNWADGQYDAFEKKLSAFTGSVGRMVDKDLKEAIDDVDHVLKRLQ